MIVRQFLHWLQTAAPGDRADATSALARAYLYSDLSPDDLAAAEGAMIMLLDDPSPLVRGALAQVFATSQKAPRVIVHALAQDHAAVAAPLLSGSPLLNDADLIDLVGNGDDDTQSLIASRPIISRPLAAALAEVGGSQACVALLDNPDADVADFSIDRMVARFGDVATIRERLLARDIPAATRHLLLSKLTDALAGFVTARNWMSPRQVEKTTREACERATIVLAAGAQGEDLTGLVGQMRANGQLNAVVILRALLCGNLALVQASLSELSGLSETRVASYMHDRNVSGFAALYARAGLPDTAYPAFREAITALREGALLGEMSDAARLKRRMIERVLTGCAESAGDSDALLALLRRFATEAAREEARLFCDDLTAQRHAIYAEPHAVAA